MSAPELRPSRGSIQQASEISHAGEDKPRSEPPGNVPPVNGAQLLTQITEFLARYLHCSEHQRTVLALWIVHTHCISAATTTPYLAIRSDHKQSGKTLCLQLLSLLSYDPACSSGFTTATLTRRMEPALHTLLLDEFQATIGTRSRSRNPLLRALLVSGSRRGIGYTGRTHERNLFCPKAFAGTGALPEMLVDRSIPILLEPLGAQAAKQKIQRFHFGRAVEQAKPLYDLITEWSKKHDPQLEQLPPLASEQFPPGLSSRRQDMIEPLLQIAEMIGGEWPKRAREALTALFEQEAVHDRKSSLQLLHDLREAFNHHGNPERISTALLLDWLHTQTNRPWNQEGPITAQTLAAMLQSFGIRSRTQRIGKASPARGYLLQDFLGCWNRLLPPEPIFNNDTSVRQPLPKPNENAPCSNVAATGEHAPAGSANDRKEPPAPAEPEPKIVWGTGRQSTAQVPTGPRGPVWIR